VVPAHIDLMQYEHELSQIDYSTMMLLKKLKTIEDQYDVVLIATPPALNLYARIALISSDYLIIPSDLKPFANQGLLNVKNLIKQVNGFRNIINKPPLEILGLFLAKFRLMVNFTIHFAKTSRDCARTLWFQCNGYCYLSERNYQSVLNKVRL
jgi:cellulose biosynthesis protein BcsQ